jgi:hypothetical protein
MSMLSCVTTCESGTVGNSVKYCEPHSPLSSPACQTKRIERRGRGPFAKASAIARSAVVPEPSSSAPL